MPQSLKFFLLYYSVVSLTSVVLTVYDKSAARKGAWRISELMLMLAGLFGGALPMFLTMKIIRHKTKHLKFMLGLPLEMLLHAALIVLWFLKSN